MNDLPAYRDHLVKNHSKDMSDMERKSVLLITDRGRTEPAPATEPALAVNPRKRKKRPVVNPRRYPGNFERYMRGMRSPARKYVRIEQEDAEGDEDNENA